MYNKPLGWAIALFLMFLLNYREAQADTLGVMVGSVHSNNYDPVARRKWNDTNPGIYVVHDNFVVGTYYNSIRKESFYVGYCYPLAAHLDVVVGAISGYNGPGYAAKPVMPMVVPSVHFGIGAGVSVRFSLAVGVYKGSATALNVALEHQF